MTAADDAVRVSRRVVLAAGAGAALASCGMRGSGGGQGSATGSSSGSAGAPSSAGGDASALPQPELRRASGTTWSTSLHATGGQADVGGRNLAVMTYEGSVPGPTIKVDPGTTLEITLRNDLEPSSGGGMGMGGMGGNGTTTNLHTHGLHVSPDGDSDNVFLAVDQGAEQRYRFAIPTNQWGGLNWYHPHHHGTVSAQVLGGMSGALIVTGALDQVPEVAAAPEAVLVLQRLQPNAGMVAQMASMHDNAFLSSNGNPTFTVNGVVRPTITVRPSSVQRWRIVQADPIDYVDLALVDDAGDPVPGSLHVLARDGLTLPHVQTVDHELLVPGGRLDVLVQMPSSSGTFQLVGRPVNGFGQPTITYFEVRVDGSPAPMAIPTTLPAALDPVPAEAVVTRRTVQYGSWGNAMEINGRSFGDDPDQMELRVDSVEEWTVQNLSDQDHVFHIHTNPFYVVARNGEALADPQWRDTFPIPAATGQDAPGSITVRFRPTDFRGRMVQHCHILPHEDAGMMGVVTLV